MVGVAVKKSVDTAWRHPADVVSGWEGASRVNPALLRHRVSGSWWECLEAAGLTLIITREYEHLVIALSVVDGKPMRHATWTECEQRVKGRSGARFKKAMSPAEQEAILRSWSFRPEDV